MATSRHIRNKVFFGPRVKLMAHLSNLKVRIRAWCALKKISLCVKGISHANLIEALDTLEYLNLLHQSELIDLRSWVLNCHGNRGPEKRLL